MSWIQKGDEGILIQLTITLSDGTTSFDISGASTKQIWLGPPEQEVVQKDASYVTDGTDGKLQYATVTDDIDVAGTWNVQAYWVNASGQARHSTVTTFEVYENVE